MCNRYIFRLKYFAHFITNCFWLIFCFFSSRSRHTRLQGDWSSDVCSSDLTSQYVRVRVPEAQLISADRNLGFAGGVNAGVRESGTPWILVLNPDIVLTRAAVERR